MTVTKKHSGSRIWLRVFAIFVASCLAVVGTRTVSLHADVLDAAANGFTIHVAAAIDAPAAKVFDVLVKPAAWWSPDHTYSGNAANLTLDLSPGGCWCEKTPNGAVEHMRVVFVDRGKVLRLRGGLGPLQAMAAAGAMTIALTEKNGTTTVDFTYTAGGYMKSGFEAMAKGVDGVLTQQVARLKKAVETGKPD